MRVGLYTGRYNAAMPLQAAQALLMSIHDCYFIYSMPALFMFFRMADQGNQDDNEGFCQLYRGAACSKFLTNKSIFVRNKLQQGRMEERLTGMCVYSVQCVYRYIGYTSVMDAWR